jgi:hypothetical protein
MTEQNITVSNGEDFFRIPISDLHEACADGFYVPALNNRTIVSDGEELFEIPNSDLAEAQADGFWDLMVAEREVIELARTILAAPAAAIATEVGGSADDVSIVDTLSPGDTSTASATEPINSPTNTVDHATDVDPSELPDPADEVDGSVLSKLLLSGGTIGGKNTWQVMLINVGLHGLIVLFLAMIILPAPDFDVFMEITSSIEPKDPVKMEFEAVELEQPMEMETEPVEMESFSQFDVESKETVDMDVSDVELSIPDRPIQTDSATGPPTTNSKTEMGGRSKAGRSSLVAKRGGNAASEAAVMQGLSWVAAHQYPDGGWSFDHSLGECKGQCSQAGSLAADCRNAATGMAILAMLGAGHTPFDGEFQQEVRNGVGFLLKNAAVVPAGLDLRGQHAGNTGMYTHAIATTALCEVLAMTRHEFKSAVSGKDKDEKKLNPQRSQLMNLNAQDRPTGGWGYNPGTPGDTSILGWQIMALKSAAHTGIAVPGTTVRESNRFLTSVQSPDGGFGYRDRTKKASTTAIGVIARMLSGMQRSDPSLKAGVEYLSALGPNKANMYYNYYGTQVMMHYGGEHWRKWNAVMRDQLVNTQVKEGHATGSWNLADAHGAKAGRLYMTCLCTMTLEVYYRHLPLYGEPNDLDSNEDNKTVDLTKNKT